MISFRKVGDLMARCWLNSKGSFLHGWTSGFLNQQNVRRLQVIEKFQGENATGEQDR